MATVVTCPVMLVVLKRLISVTGCWRALLLATARRVAFCNVDTDAEGAGIEGLKVVTIASSLLAEVLPTKGQPPSLSGV